MATSAVIGLIPAGGQGLRLNSAIAKELIPLAWAAGNHDHLESICSLDLSVRQLVAADVRRVVVITSENKPSLAAYLHRRYARSVELAFVLQRTQVGLPGAIFDAEPWCRHDTVAMVLPDTVVTPPDALRSVLAHHTHSGADLTLGVFPTDYPHELGPVEITEGGRVTAVLDKPPTTPVDNTWGMACWGRRFSELLSESVGRATVDAQLALGTVFQDAVSSGLHVCGHEPGSRADPATYLDVGTPQHLLEAWRRLSGDPAAYGVESALS